MLVVELELSSKFSLLGHIPVPGVCVVQWETAGSQT